MNAERAGDHDSYAAFRYPDYRRYIGMVSLSSIVQNGQSVAVGWDVYERTGSALALGWVGLVQFLAALIAFLPAGIIADSRDRRRTVSISFVLTALSALVLAASSWWAGSVWWIYGALALSSAATVVNRAARDALLPRLVPAAVFPSAIAWNASCFQIASIASPALAGILIAVTAGATASYVMNLVCLVTASGLAIGMATQPLESAGRPRSAHDLFVGVKHFWREKIILGTATIDLFGIMFASAVALMPIYAKDILEVGPTGLGWLAAAPAVGATAMAIAQGHLRPFMHVGRSFFWAFAVYGIAIMVFGVSQWFWLSLVALVVVGAADNVGGVIRQTLVQVYTPDDMRGRVSAVNRVFITSSNELAALRSGALAAAVGPVTTVVAGGIATLAVVAWGLRAFPALRELKDMHRDDRGAR